MSEAGEEVLGDDERVRGPEELGETLRQLRERLERARGSGEEGGPYRRRTILVDPQLQLSHLSVYLATFALLLLGFVAYYLMFRFQFQRAARLSQELAEGGVDPQFSGVVILVFVVLVAVGMATFAILQSHRIAGPALRFRRALAQLQRRDYDFVLQLRRRDYLQDVAEHVNGLAEVLKAKDLVLTNAALELLEAAEEVDEATRARLEALADELSAAVEPL